MLFEHPDDGGNMLTKASVDLLWELDSKIVDLEVRPDATIFFFFFYSSLVSQPVAPPVFANSAQQNAVVSAGLSPPLR